MKKEELAKKISYITERLDYLKRHNHPRSRLMRQNYRGRVKGLKEELSTLKKEYERQ